MASPQTENGFTKISNELLEVLCQCQLPSDAYQLFLCIVRNTYGWNKKSCQLGTSQLMSMTGLRRQAVYKSRKKLLQFNMITVVEKDYSQVLTYSIQKDYEKWQLVSKTTIVRSGANCSPAGRKTVVENDYRLLSKERKKEKKKGESLLERVQTWKEQATPPPDGSLKAGVDKLIKDLAVKKPT